MTKAEHRISSLILAVLAALLVLALMIAEVLAETTRVVTTRPAWAEHVRKVEEAVTNRDARLAELAWRKAYTAALGSPDWRGMLAVGDASLRIGELEGAVGVYRSRTRQTYLDALSRARAQRSVEGILRVAEAFSALGDRAVVLQCLRMAENVAGKDERARARVRAFTAEQERDGSVASGAIRLEPY